MSDTFQSDDDALSHAVAAQPQAQAAAPKKRVGGMLGGGGIGSIANIAQLAANPQALVGNLFPAIGGASPVAGMMQSFLLPQINGVLATGLARGGKPERARVKASVQTRAQPLRLERFVTSHWRRTVGSASIFEVPADFKDVTNAKS